MFGYIYEVLRYSFCTPCVAVVQAVQKAGLCAVLLPIDKQTLNLDIKCLKKNLSVLIIQNTLGMPQPHIHQVIKFCKQNKIILIEDLAHSVGAIYDNGWWQDK